MASPRRNRALRFAITTGAIVAVLTIAALAIRFTFASPDSGTNLTPAEQAEAVLGTRDLSTWPEETPGMLPLAVVPVSEFLTDLNQAPTGSEVYLPSDGHLAVLLTNPDTVNATLTAATLVDGQAKDIADAAVASGSALTVVETPDAIAARSNVNRASGGEVSAFALTLIMVLFVGLIIFAVAMRLRRSREFGGDIDSPSPMGNTGVLASRRARKKAAAGATAIPNTRFEDVAGCDEAVEDLREIVDFLRDRERFAAVGATPPAGAVLIGPPGTGKTLLARAVAGEAGVPFYAVSGSDFQEKYVGVGASRVRGLFKKAKAAEGGAIIFIDEIDAVGRARGGHNSHPEQENTLNALLVEMDGFTGSNVIVLAATNRHDMLDKALTRPGRLDREVQVPLPDRLGREAILKVHAADRPIRDDVDFTLVARRTPGMSGAELARVVNEACLVAVRDGRNEVTNNDFDHAIATAAMGRARTSAVVTDHDREITAWHEAGHTLCAMLTPHADPPVSVSIIPRGPAGGVTWMAQGDDQFLTRKAAHARLITALGGRAAEEILLDGEFTSGAYGDLTSATRLAFAMVTQYGMTEAGLMVRDEGMLQAATGSTDAAVAKVEAMLADALAEARALLTANMDLLQAVSEALLDRDNLNADDLERIRQDVLTTRTTSAV